MFRFTSRDVLWLMVVVGMGCAWSVEYFCSDRRWLEFRAGALEGCFRSKGFEVEYDRPWAVRVTGEAGSYEFTQWADGEASEKSKWRVSRQSLPER
jgi:hypothetical protein